MARVTSASAIGSDEPDRVTIPCTASCWAGGAWAAEKPFIKSSVRANEMGFIPGLSIRKWNRSDLRRDRRKRINVEGPPPILILCQEPAVEIRAIGDIGPGKDLVAARSHAADGEAAARIGGCSLVQCAVLASRRRWNQYDCRFAKRLAFSVLHDSLDHSSAGFQNHLNRLVRLWA